MLSYIVNKEKYININKLIMIREAFKTMGHLPNRGGGGSDQIGRLTQPPYLVIRNVKTTSHFLKVTPLTWASDDKLSFKYSYNNDTINVGVLDDFLKKSLSSLFWGHRFL